MKSKIHIRINNRYPQNYILKNPLFGSALFTIICLVFLVTYRPLKMNESQYFSFPVTMAAYFFPSAISVFLFIRLIKILPYFANKNEWNILKEIVAIFMALFGAGTTIYFMGFVLEEPADRWNFSTYIDSCKYAFLIGIIPFGFFTLINYRYLLYQEVSLNYKSDPSQSDNTTLKKEELIHIISRLKKEELKFYPQQFLYVESDGNYLNFHLTDGQKCRKEVIRNSMNEIERQLSHILYFSRIHRAFIVNVKKVKTKKGNALGYKLRLFGTDEEIPVSRQNVQSFDQLVNKFKNELIL